MARLPLAVVALSLSFSYNADATAVRARLPPPRPRGGDAVAMAATKGVPRGVLSHPSRTGPGISDDGAMSPKDVPFLALAGASVSLSVAALVIGSGILNDCLAWSCLVLGPSTAILARKVEHLVGMRDVTNELKEEAHKMALSNAALRDQNRRLTKNAEKLKNTASTLEQISSAQGISVDRLVDQVNEYREIQEAMRADLRSKIRQTLLGAFVNSDTDGDFVIDPEEVDRLVLRLGSIPSVEFNEARFRKAIKKDGGDISKFADRHLKAGKNTEKDGIFKF